ncbi:hypothetical protein JAAARDRAFT_28186 [Jaapia argillacea MUCL 33604]|uniref:Non-specific serine/threonine protein kinase n=1 Tax=Jaapia argillacea MUCL 33604 TaxID=933084 RepID=A0A067QM08_9AGAM|nr:hypothetical protein JAAARDRAFT_28186 [Jaapia argillacea MUCL 33604]
MDNVPPMGSASDLEIRAAKIADPGIDLKTKLTVVNELREMIDTVKEDSARVLPHMLPVLLEILRSGEAVYRKDAIEFQFRRAVLEIVHRIPFVEAMRAQSTALFSGLIYLLRHDNEENGVTCAKTLIEIGRSYRASTEEHVTEVMSLITDMLHNASGLLVELLADDSPPQDPNVVLPSIRSFKVLAEMGMVAVTMAQTHRTVITPLIQTLLPLNFEFLAKECPAQKRKRENCEAMGSHWTGMAPEVRNPQAYADFTNAQIKTISYLAYVLRSIPEQYDTYGETVIIAALRLLQDCPSTSMTARRDLLIVLRHLLSTPYRRALVPKLDQLFDENILLGRGVGAKEMLRASGYGSVADFSLQCRAELTTIQLTRISYTYTRLIHNSAFTSNVHTVFIKMMMNFIEPILTKDTQQNSARVIGAILDACVDRLEAMNVVQAEALVRLDRMKKGEKLVDFAFVEKARPVGGATYALEKPEDVLHESRLLFRTLLLGMKACLMGLKKCDAPIPDGRVITPLFEGCLKGMSLCEADPRELSEAMDFFVQGLTEVNLHVLQEVWTHKIGFFFECAQKRPALLQICQGLYMKESISPTLVAIVLRFLIDRLSLLGEENDQVALVTIRLYKMTFSAVTAFPTTNETLLASHLGKLIMDCFPLAAKATKPANYYYLLRGLFRAIGGGGGRFELLYKEVLPLLPDMLESLNRQLQASEGTNRDMIVELCLTVPLRLTHLLPHLTYLMQPLALALRGTPELISQGLRTLELCIDNLTPDFLDPTLNTVLRELMEALHSLLKPLPANHPHAHTTIRILGKLGGRNRRLLNKEPSLQYHPPSTPAKVSVPFSGRFQDINLGPVSELAIRVLRRGPSHYRLHGYNYLENCLLVLLNEGIHGRDQEVVFVRSLEGMYDAVHLDEIQERAEDFIRKLSRHVFRLETRRGFPTESGPRRYPTPLLSCYLNALPHALARENPQEAQKAQKLVSCIIQDLIALGNDVSIAMQDVIPTLHQIASRFSALCQEDSWVRKSAGCSGIKIMTFTPDVGAKWISERDIDLVRTLLHVLKELPSDLPRDVDEVIDVLTRILKVSHAELQQTLEQGPPASLSAQQKTVRLSGIFFSELASSNSIVRRAAQTCTALLVELSGKTVVDLLLPHRDRVLSSIYTKPLRAVPLPIQIGMVEAVRFCVSLEPPLPELNDELLRLLHETLGLADADDVSLLGRTNPRQGTIEIIKLRVACIRLLTASMPITDFFSRQPQTRQRVTSVYFKSLYSASPEVKEVAHEGLRMVLSHQSRLPKELLQTGLRPILMNLADPNRLSVPGLEGLARLLELLTNYFKVEIGHKLLDHFRIVADPQMLQASSRLPLPDNEGITKLVRLANIFHLLPSAANIFLENLVNSIVQTEAQMHFSGITPFSDPLAKYLDRYPVDAIDFFMRHLHFPRHVRTLRTILQAGLGPNLLQQLASRTSFIVGNCLQGSDQSLVLPGIQLCADLTALRPSWLLENGWALDALLSIWDSEPPRVEPAMIPSPDIVRRYSLLLEILQQALKQTPRIDLLFKIVSIYTRELPIDLIRLTHFLYDHVAFDTSTIYRRNVLLRFLIWFPDQTIPWTYKSHFLRLIVTPTLLVHASNSDEKHGLLDADMVLQFLTKVWQPMLDSATFSDADDIFKIELLHLTTVMVQHYHNSLEDVKDVKKDVLKVAWHYIASDDPVVKQSAYLLAARFFEAFETPPKFILRAWTGLLRGPHTELRGLIRQALDILAPVIPRSCTDEPGYPQWAKNTRRLLAEEGSGMSQIIIIYQLIVRQPQLFYPVRALFIPHVVNSLSKLGLSSQGNPESRLLSIDILQVVFEWEQKASESRAAGDSAGSDHPNSVNSWTTPLVFRETIVSFLVRLATSTQEPQARSVVVPRALALLRSMVSPNGWSDVTVKLNYFSRSLEQNELNSEPAVSQAVSSARVLDVISADKSDSWFTTNADILQKLVRKGMTSEEHGLHDSLHPIFDRLLRLFPLPKEDEEQQSELSEFHRWAYSAIGDALRNNTALRGALLMLKSVVQVNPERIEPFASNLMRLLSKLAKEHITTLQTSNGLDSGARLLMSTLEICQIGVVWLGDQRRWLLSSLVVLAEKSKNIGLCRYILDVARDWALHKRDSFPTLKEKASLLQKMDTLEHRGEGLFNSYLELIYDIYTDPGLRRSDLTTRLEKPFLLGCRCKDPVLRERFIDLLDVSVPRSLLGRLSYVLGVQSWEPLAEVNWAFLALHLILGTVDNDAPLTDEHQWPLDSSPLPAINQRRAHDIVRPMQRLLFLDASVAHETWVSVFSSLWSRLSRREQVDTTHHMITLLSKDHHIRQAELRPNIIQTLLSGIHACSPPMTLPPHLVRYLAKNYNAWHVALELLENSLDHLREDEVGVRDTVFDALADVYAELAEDDMFYGLWRRRCLHSETNVAISFEQNGLWEQASTVYEVAQTKARAGAIPFSEPEYCLWEDHWILAAEKLQQWDVLHDLGKNEGNLELQLESAWRIKNWAEEKDTLDGLVRDHAKSFPLEAPPPRVRVYQAFLSLLMKDTKEDGTEQNSSTKSPDDLTFPQLLESGMQLSLRKWVGLPVHLSPAHVPLLQLFQQFVELQEAVQIFGSLAATNAQNLEKQSSDLKMILQAWRERLPDRCDDISIWSDLVAWRQNVFHAINKAYVPLIQNAPPPPTNSGNTNQNTAGYRGYHETAWIINRFAHVARKHDLLDVCFTYLNKIYTLPNIEISEAFLKLREQARCHYQKPNDLAAGLEVINNTNLMYFQNNQKAEFFTLKGMFHARLQRPEEANQAFGSAVQLDMNQAKAWAEWGRYNDRLFKEKPNEMGSAANAISCYLQAAGLYKSGKSRPLLTRVLWLLSVDDGTLTISRAFDTYKGDAAFWYWITLIPQLCLSISQREVKQARYLLLNLAKLYPQALFFPLRNTREDMAIVKKQAATIAAARANALNTQASVRSPAALDPSKRPDSDRPVQNVSNDNTSENKYDGTSGTEAPQPPQGATRPGADAPQIQPSTSDSSRPAMAVPHTQGSADATPYLPQRQTWEYVEEVVAILKTAFPLLVLSLETLVDQINQRFKPGPEEEIYRFTCMLLQDAIQNYVLRMNSPDDDGQLQPSTVANLTRMAVNFTGPTRKEYEEDFLKSKQSHYDYIRQLQRWRDKYEKHLDSRPRTQPLDLLSHYLTEFQYTKFDELEVPGQYTEDKDSNQNFIRIQKFHPKFENCRTHGYCWRRFTIHGNDGSKTTFAVQHPSGRHCRREERVMQLFRTFNGTLTRKKESRKRNLTFHLPAAISCSPGLRLLQNDSSYITLGDIFDQSYEAPGVTREDPILAVGEKVKAVLRDFNQSMGRMPSKSEYFTLKKEILDEVMTKIVPEDILTKYMLRTMNGPGELWRIRKQFTTQIAATAFMTYILCLTSRLPSRFHLSRASGQIAMSELLPGVSGQGPILHSNDTVPFRFTPNMQRFVGPIFTEGVLTSAIMAIGRSLTEPEFDLEQQLCLFARDEVMTWLHGRGKPWNAQDISFRNNVAMNIDGVVKRAETMACKIEREQALQTPTNPGTGPAVQTVTNLISMATNPINLAKMTEIYYPWY